MTDFRALCQELLEALEYEAAAAEASGDWAMLRVKAGAALAQPEPKRPTDGELMLTYTRAVAAAVDGKRGPFSVEDAKAAQLAGLRAVLDQ